MEGGSISMPFIAIDELIYFAVQFVSFFLLTFMGSILKEIYDTNSSPDHEFSAYKVFNGTIVGTIMCIIIHEYYLDSYNWKLMVAVGFLTGLIGSEIFVRFSNIKGVKTILEVILNRKLPDIEESAEAKENDAVSNKETTLVKQTPKVHIHLYKDENKK